MIEALRLIARTPALRLIMVAILCLGAGNGSIGPYQSLIAVQLFGLPDRVYSVLLATASLVAVSGSVGVGIMSDQRANRRLLAILCAGLLATGMGLVRLTPSAFTFILAHALLLPLSAGLFGQLFALARIVCADMAAEQRDSVATVIRAAFALPFLLVLPLWALALNAGMDLLQIYAGALGMALVVLALIVWRWPADATLPAVAAPSGISLRAALAEMAAPALMIRLLALGLARVSVTIYMVLLSLLFIEVAHRAQGDVALFAGLVAGLEVPFMLISIRLSRRMSRPVLIAVGVAIHATFMLAFSQVAVLPFVMLLAIPAAMGAAVLLTVPIGYVQDLLAHRPGTGSALIAVNQFLTDILAACAFAVGTAVWGYPSVALIAAGMSVCGALALVWLDRGAARPAVRVG